MLPPLLGWRFGRGPESSGFTEPTNNLQTIQKNKTKHATKVGTQINVRNGYPSIWKKRMRVSS